MNTFLKKKGLSFELYILKEGDLFSYFVSNNNNQKSLHGLNIKLAFQYLQKVFSYFSYFSSHLLAPQCLFNVLKSLYRFS